MSDHDPPILIVNEEDRPIGSAPKTEAQAKGLIHRIVQVMVENPDGQILLQKRSADSALYPGRWDMSVGGHVDAGEDYLDAAEREMQEEIGLKGVKLIEAGKYRKDSVFEGRKLNRFYKVYKTSVPADTEFKPEPSEVAELRWFTIDQAKRQAAASPENFTFSVPEALDRYYP